MAEIAGELRDLKAQNDALLNRVRRLRQLEEAEALAALEDEEDFYHEEDTLLREAEAALRSNGRGSRRRDLSYDGCDRLHRSERPRREVEEYDFRRREKTEREEVSSSRKELPQDNLDHRVKKLQGLVVKLFVDRYEARETLGLERYALSRAVKTSLLAASLVAWRKAICPRVEASRCLLDARAEVERLNAALRLAAAAEAEERIKRKRAEDICKEEEMRRKAQEEIVRRLVEDVALERRRRLEAEAMASEAMAEIEAEAEARRQAEINALEARSELTSRELVLPRETKNIYRRLPEASTKKTICAIDDDDTLSRSRTPMKQGLDETNSVQTEAALVRTRVEGLLDTMRKKRSADKAQWERERLRLAEIRVMSLEDERSRFTAVVLEREASFKAALAKNTADLESRLDKASALHLADLETFRARVEAFTTEKQSTWLLEDAVKHFEVEAADQRLKVLSSELHTAKTALNASHSVKIRSLSPKDRAQSHTKSNIFLLSIITKWLATPPLRAAFATWRHYVQADYRAHVLRLIKSHVTHLKHKMIASKNASSAALPQSEEDRAAILTSLHQAADLLHATLRRGPIKRDIENGGLSHK